MNYQQLKRKIILRTIRRKATPKVKIDERVVAGLGAVGAIALSLTAGLFLYSRLFAPRKVALMPAIEARQTHVTLPTAGSVAYYADTTALGRPLVLIHSINAAASAYEMRPLFERFRGGRPVYALDLPGFGFSERSDRRYSPELYTRALIEFVEQEVGQPADVVALSLSSEFAASAALLRPDLFETLTMISPSGLAGEDKQKASQKASTSGKSNLGYRLLSFPLWSQLIYDLLTTRGSIRSFLKMSFVADPPQALVEYDYATTHQPGAKYAPLYFVSGQLFTPDIRQSVYEKLELPVMVIYDQDPYVNFDMLPHMIQQRPNWNERRITPTRGLAHWDMTDATVNALETFWNVLTPTNSR